MQKAVVEVEEKEEYMKEKANNKIFWKRGAAVREDDREREKVWTRKVVSEQSIFELSSGSSSREAIFCVSFNR